MTGFEGPVMEGEMVPCMAVLQNTGSVDLQNLRLLVSEPDLFCCPSAEQLDRVITNLEGNGPFSISYFCTLNLLFDERTVTFVWATCLYRKSRLHDIKNLKISASS